MFELFDFGYIADMPPQGALHLGVVFGALFSETVKKGVGAYKNRAARTER